MKSMTIFHAFLITATIIALGSCSSETSAPGGAAPVGDITHLLNGPAGEKAVQNSLKIVKDFAGDNASYDRVMAAIKGVYYFAIRQSLSGKSSTNISTSVRETLAVVKAYEDVGFGLLMERLEAILIALYPRASTMFDQEGHLTQAGKHEVETLLTELSKKK